jgi:hypothetical protein
MRAARNFRPIPAMIANRGMASSKLARLRAVEVDGPEKGISFAPKRAQAEALAQK